MYLASSTVHITGQMPDPIGFSQGEPGQLRAGIPATVLPCTCVPSNRFADEVLPRPPRCHSELQLRPAEIILFPCLCAQDHPGGFAGGPATHTQMPEKEELQFWHNIAVMNFGARSSFEA